MTPSPALDPYWATLSLPRVLERRVHARLRPARSQCCQLLLKGMASPLTAWVQNLTGRGMAVLVDRPLQPDEQMEVMLISPQATSCLRAPLKVTRHFQTETGDWYVHGVFERNLTPQELGPFVV